MADNKLKNWPMELKFVQFQKHSNKLKRGQDWLQQ